MRIIGIDVPGLRRADACRGQGRAGRRDAASTRARKPSRGRCRRRAAGAQRQPTVTLRRRDVPGRSGRHRHDARAARARGRSGGADARVARAVCGARLRRRSPRFIRSTRRRSASSTPPGAPIVGSAPVGLRRHRRLARGDRRRVRRRAATRSTRRRTACCPRSGRAREARRSRAASRCRATKAPNCWSRGCWSRAAPTCATSAPPARARRGRIPIANGSRRKGVRVQYRASLEQDLAAMRRVRARPRHRHDAGRAEGEGDGDSGAVLHQPHLGAAADGAGGRRLARAGGQRRARRTRRASTR